VNAGVSTNDQGNVGVLTVVQDKPAPAKDETFHREIIVNGDDALSKTIAEELRGAGARIIKINSAADLLGAGVHRARAVVCAGPNDAVNLEIGFTGKAIQPQRPRGGTSGNDVLPRSGGRRERPGRDLGRRGTRHTIPGSRRCCHATRTSSTRPASNSLSGEPRRRTRRRCARSTGTWRRWRWSTARTRPNPGEVVPCPGRDEQVYPGDWTSMIGLKDELESPRDHRAAPDRDALSQSLGATRIDAARAMRDDVNPLLFPSLAFALFPDPWLDSRGAALPTRTRRCHGSNALYFTSETITTVGYGRIQLRPAIPFSCDYSLSG